MITYECVGKLYKKFEGKKGPVELTELFLKPSPDFKIEGDLDGEYIMTVQYWGNLPKVTTGDVVLEYAPVGGQNRLVNVENV